MKFKQTGLDRQTRAMTFAFMGLACSLAGCIYTDIQTPLSYRANTYGDVVGRAQGNEPIVSGRACNTAILGLVAWGDGGYDSAVQDAMSKTGGAVSLYDVKADHELTNVLGVYIQSCTVVDGRAVK